MPPRKGSTRKATAALRKHDVLRYKVAGMTHMEIADRVGVSTASVSKYLHQELDKLADETRAKTSQYRDLEVRRLNDLQRQLWPLALGYKDKERTIPPDLAAVDRVLRIVELRARLMGVPKNTPEETIETGRVVLYLPQGAPPKHESDE